MVRPATILSARRATPRSVLLRLAVESIPRFAAGQAVLVGAAGADTFRPYSIAVGPHEARRTNTLELLVGIGEDGTAGPHLPSLDAGARVDVQGPVGSFVYPARVEQSAVLFVAGGSGIAPLRAMIHEALDGGASARGTPSLRLLYSARSPREFAFDDELSGLARAGRIIYRKTATRETGAQWPGDRGRIRRSQLEPLVERADDILCFVCGPAALVHEVPQMLAEIGVAPGRVRVEEWAAPPASAS